MSIADKLLTVAGNTPSVVEKVNAAKTTVSGTAVRADDVLGVAHKMGVRVSSKNILPYPYYHPSMTYLGITYTDNGDGTITANGTATADSNFVLWVNTETWSGSYALSGCPEGGSDSTYFIQTFNGFRDTGMGRVFSAVHNREFQRIAIFIKAGVTVENLVFKPQLEIGSAVTEYTPYITDLSGVSVSGYGKNLLSVMSVFNTVTNNAHPIYMKAGEVYTFSMDGDYTAWRLMLFGTEMDGTPFRQDESGGNNPNYYIVGMYTGVSGRLQSSMDRTGTALTLSCVRDCIVNAVVFWMTGTENTPYTLYQLELGEVATAYEPYLEPQTAITAADGRVEELAAWAGVMTIVSDMDGVTVECTYFPESAADTVEKYLAIKQEMKTLSDSIKEE